MNKQDFSGIRKEFKEENPMLKIKETYSVYLKKDNQNILHSELKNFNSFENEKQELYLKNFKKILSGGVDTKLFELDFLNIDNEDNAQKILYPSINGDKEAFQNASDSIVKRISQNYKYETDVVITFIRAEYFKGANKISKEADESIDDSLFCFEFMMCSINKIDFPKRALQYDFISKEFKVNYSLDAIINFNSPIEGFMFPCFNNSSSDVNRVMYYSNKANGINMDFIHNILNCEFKKTAEDEKSEFDSILKNMIGEKIAPSAMHNIYEKLCEKLQSDEEDRETPKINLEDMEDILKESGIENVENLEYVYKEAAGDRNYEFKIQNVLPNMSSKSIKVSTENINLSFAPTELKNIRKVRDSHGNLCLLIELMEDVSIDGFQIETEEI